MISAIKEKQTDGWMEHWPDACNCPKCGNGKDAFRFLHLCSNTKSNIQPVYDTWLECSGCGHRGSAVSKPFQTWYIDLICGEETILIAAISNWNRDCKSQVPVGNLG